VTAARAALCLLLLAGGGGGARADAFDDADETAARLDARISVFNSPRLAGRYANEADCLARFDLDALLRDAKSTAMISDLSGQMDPVVQYSFRYYTCVAAVRKDENACGLLSLFDDYARPHPHLECTRYSKELIFIRALMTGGPNLPALCRADLTHAEDNEFLARDIDPVCAIMLADYRRPSEACGKLAHYNIKPSQLKKCEAWLGSFSGDDVPCRGLEFNDVRERCFAYAYFHKARETGDVKDCKGSGICEMFMGGGEPACAYYSRRISAHLCPLQDKRNARMEKERADLEADLDKAESSLNSLPPGAAADLRRKRLQRVRRLLGKRE
jgi:hypothetical protein